MTSYSKLLSIWIKIFSDLLLKMFFEAKLEPEIERLPLA